MKKITAIVRAEKLEVLKDALFAADVRGMTINQVQGCGAQHGWKEYVRGNELLVNTIPKVQFTLICADEHVDGIVEIICNAARHRSRRRRQDLGRAGRGSYPYPHRRTRPRRRCRTIFRLTGVPLLGHAVLVYNIVQTKERHAHDQDVCE